MRRKHFKLFFLVTNLALVTLPYMVIAATGGFISQRKPGPTICVPETTKNCMFILRTISWLPDNCCMRYKLLIELKRKWPFNIS